jgi:hypothetical protein
MIRKIVDDDNSDYSRHFNSSHRARIRRLEKNKFPIKCRCVICKGDFECRGIEQYLGRQYYLGPDKRGNVRHVCWACGLESKIKVTAATLFHLVGAIPLVERDSNEIYPNDFR